MCSKTKRITIRLSDSDYDYLVSKSKDLDLPIAYLVRELIKQDKKFKESAVSNNG